MKRKRKVQSIKNKNEKFQTTTITTIATTAAAAPCSWNVEYAENWTNQYVYRILLGSIHIQIDRSMYAPYVDVCECLFMHYKLTKINNRREQDDTTRQTAIFEEKKVWTEFYFDVSVSDYLSMRVCEYVFKAPFNLLLKRLLNFSIVCSSVLFCVNASCNMDLNSGFSIWTWLCHIHRIRINWFNFRHSFVCGKLQWTFFSFSLNSFYACL